MQGSSKGYTWDHKSLHGDKIGEISTTGVNYTIYFRHIYIFSANVDIMLTQSETQHKYNIAVYMVIHGYTYMDTIWTYNLTVPYFV